MANEVEPMMIEQAINIAPCSREEIINTYHGVSHSEQAFAQVRANKACAAGD
jgi:hypothetical protein